MAHLQQAPGYAATAPMVQIVPIDDESIARAARILRDGGLVAFPTETVYGLGANACSDTAVARIFAAKDRPDFNPLIVHVQSGDDAADLVRFDASAARLAEHFWPGPLTLVLPRRTECPVSLLATAGLATLAVRVPGRDDARTLLREAGIPVAAPSANPSGRVSPTTARHVAAGLGDKVDLILDGGACTVGLESTVVDCSTDVPTLLRPGGIAREGLEAQLHAPLAVADETGDGPKAPGMLARHYATRLPLRLDARSPRAGEAMLGFGTVSGATLNLSARGDLTEAAANLFAYLHQLDEAAFTGIAVSPIPEDGLGRAINDRLRRAARR